MAPLIAAASNSESSTGALLLLALVSGAAYVVHCVIWPFRSCAKCDGMGRFRSPSGRAWRYCHVCNGRGAQLRIGRRVWTFLKDTHNRDRRTRP